jgi:hypothetical protein
MTERKLPAFLESLEPQVAAKLPLQYRFARVGREFNSVEPMWSASEVHRERCHTLMPFYKPISRPLPSPRGGGTE